MISVWRDMDEDAHLSRATRMRLPLGDYLAMLARWEREGAMVVLERNDDGSPCCFELAENRAGRRELKRKHRR